LDKQLDVVVVRMLADNLGCLDNKLQTLLQAANIGSQADEGLEIDIPENPERSSFAAEGGNAVLRYAL
jgi:hypothetical protein